jgi:hypothetical protein
MKFKRDYFLEKNMLSKRRFWMACAVLAVLLVIFLALMEIIACYYMPKITAAFLLNEEGGRRAITLPFSERSSKSNVVYTYEIELEWQQGGNTRFRVIPDDYLESITVNGQFMPEERYPEPGRKDWQKGLIVDFDAYLDDGINNILFKIADYGGNYSMHLTKKDFYDTPVQILVFSLACLFILFLLWFSLFSVISRR